MARAAVTWMCGMNPLRLAVLLLLLASAEEQRLGPADILGRFFEYRDSPIPVEAMYTDIRKMVANVINESVYPLPKPLPAGIHCAAERNERLGTCHSDMESCFCKPLYDNASVQVYHDVMYSEKHSLLLDLYMPPWEGGQAERPAILQVHGGDFRGIKENSGQRNFCRLFAMHGYICVSIEYRLLGVCCGRSATLHAGVYDAKAAVRWLRRHADTLNLDASRIAGFGTSLGGAILIGMMLSDEEGDSGNEGYSSELRVMVAVSSAYPYRQLRFPDPATRPRPPYINFHACGDTVMPYSQETETLGAAMLDATTTHDLLRRAGVDAHLWSFSIVQHIPWQAMLGDDAEAHNAMLGVLKQHMGLDGTQCAPTSGAVTAEEREAISRRNATLAAMWSRTMVDTVSAWRATAARFVFPETHAAVALGPGSRDNTSHECLLNHARASSAPPPPEAFSYDHGLVVTCCDLAGRPSNPGCAKRMNYFEATIHCDSVGMRLCSIGELAAASPEPTGCHFGGRHAWVLDPCGPSAGGRLEPVEPHISTKPRWTGEL